uniref:Synaptonemal complex protein 2-like n=1 Tax=Esox lucius TaxID=8010 RepID=A0A6Q2XPJ6_ESOLU
MVLWFEKARQLWIETGTQRNENLLNLAEDLFDSIMVVHESSREGTYQVTEFFLHLTGQLAGDPQVHIMIQKEAIRKLNIILDKIPVELKKDKKIFLSQEASDVMKNLASRIVDCGDYDLQIALMEALCRMTTRTQRMELADRWFTMEFIARAFCKIQDSAFETDCRIFLNLVNGMQGDQRRVFSYPCLEAFLDKHELLMPSDEKLEEFWIDFNLGSQTVSFYFSLADEDAEEGQWDTVCINENEVQSYTVTEEVKRKVLKLELLEPLCVSRVEGSKLTIHFSSSLDILKAASSVYGHKKNKAFVAKSSTSVVKTTVKIIMEENGFLMVTPAKSRVSESSTFITSSGGGRGVGASPFSIVRAASTPGGGKAKVKPVLELVSSCERQGQPGLGKMRTAKPCYNTAPGCTQGHGNGPQVAPLQNKTAKQGTRAGCVAEKYRRHIPVDKAVEMVQTDPAGDEDLLADIVPDSQPNIATETSLFPHCRKMSVSQMFLPVQKVFRNSFPKPDQQQLQSPAQKGSGSVPGSAVSNRQPYAQLNQRLEEVLHERDQGTWPEERTGCQRGGPEKPDGAQRREAQKQCGVQGTKPEERGGVPGTKPEERGGVQGTKPEERGGVQGRVAKERCRVQGRGAEERGGVQGRVAKERCRVQGRGAEERGGVPGTKPEERSGVQGRVAKERCKVQGRGPEERVEPTVRGAKESQQQAGRLQAEGKPKSKMSNEAKATPGKAPVKTPQAKDLQERTTPNTPVKQMKTTESNSSKDKREAGVTGTMMKFISSQYKSRAAINTKEPGWAPSPSNSRSVFERSWLPPSVVGTGKGPGYMKSYTNSKKPRVERQGGDVFAFEVDTPRSTGGNRTKSSDTFAIDSSANNNSWALPNSTTKGQAIKVSALRRQVKKHLFSDTDTDAMTEVSWLRESSRKPKPKVTDYSRRPRRHVPGPALNTTYESPDLPPTLPKPVKENAKLKKKRHRAKSSGEERKDTVAPVVAGTRQAARRSQRAAATNAKSYREPDSASQSETEERPPPKKRCIGPAEKSKNVCKKVAGLMKKTDSAIKNIMESNSTCQSETESPKP